VLMKQYGLIGYPLAHSFSEKYFKDKFRKEHINDATYQLFPIKHIDQLPNLIHNNPSLDGFNVTIPFKQAVISYLDELDDVAQDVGSVNCVKIIRGTKANKLIGFNTDVIGFEASLKPFLKSYHQNAIILGTGGSSRAVAYVLNKLGIPFTIVSRNAKDKNTINYHDLTKLDLNNHLLVINTTPLGMYPNTQTYPQFPYEDLTGQHLLVDLVYNPEQTLFLQKGKLQGSAILSGLEMLYLQADKSFEIWNL